MIDNRELEALVKRARDAGAIIRLKRDSSMCIVGVSLGRVPGGEYRRLGMPGTGWMPPIAASERLHEILAATKGKAVRATT